MHLIDALAKGYFPREIPPCFSSAAFAQVAASMGRPPVGARSAPTPFSLGRAGGVRRNLEVPNPFSQLLIAETCEAHWTQLQRLTARSSISLSRPVRDRRAGRSLANRVPLEGAARALVGKMPGGRVTLKADVSQFYASVYTHAVDWSIRGKRAAKRSIRAQGLGPDLDRLLRNSRQGQTIGLSIGPDTSWLVAEVLMAQVDAALERSIPQIAKRGARFSDDLTFYATSVGEAEDVLAGYQRALQEFELNLNPVKVTIRDGLEPLEPAWVRQLRRHDYRDTTDAQLASDVLDVFDLALEARASFPTQGVLSYAMKRCNPFPGGGDSWPLFRDLVMASVILEPSSLAHGYYVLEFGASHGLPLDRDRLAAQLNDALELHAKLDRGYEVAWILFLMRELALPLELAAGRQILSMEDNCSLVLLRDLADRRPRQLNALDFTPAVRRAEVVGALSSSDWLMAYEYRHAGWAKPVKWDGDPLWRDLHRAGVSFYTRLPPPRRIRLHRMRPAFVPHWTGYPATGGV